MTYLPKIISQVGNAGVSVCIHKMGAWGRGRWAAVETWRKKLITSGSRVWIMKELAFKFVLYGQLGYWWKETEREVGCSLKFWATLHIPGMPNLRTKLFLDKESKTSLGEPHPYLCDNWNSKLEFQSRKLLGPTNKNDTWMLLKYINIYITKLLI